MPLQGSSTHVGPPSVKALRETGVRRGGPARIESALTLVLSLTPSGLGFASTETVTTPADETASVRVDPEPLSAPPLTEYDAPALTQPAVPDVSVPYARTRSVWNVGNGLLHA